MVSSTVSVVDCDAHASFRSSAEADHFLDGLADHDMEVGVFEESFT